MNWSNLYNIDPNDPWAMPSFWKANLTFEDLELSPFKYYETVISPAEITAAVSLGATGFQQNVHIHTQNIQRTHRKA